MEFSIGESNKKINNNESELSPEGDEDDEEAEENYEHSQHRHARVKCLRRDHDCKSHECERVEECTDPAMSTHCYVAMQEVHDSMPSAENSSNASWMMTARNGCWSGGDDCEPPEELQEKYQSKPHHYDNVNSEYKIPNSLLNPAIQQSCIRYKPAIVGDTDESISLGARKNHTFCCCRFGECNRRVYVSSEPSPAVLLALQANPRVRTTTKKTDSLPPLQPPSWQSEHLNLFALFSLVFLLLMLAVVCAYLFYKKKQLKRRLKQIDALPTVRYSKTNSDDDEDFDQMNRVGPNKNNMGDVTNLTDNNKNEMITDYLNNRLPPNVTLSPQMMMTLNGSKNMPSGAIASNNINGDLGLVPSNVQVVMPIDPLLIMPPQPQPNRATGPINIASLLNDLKEIEDIQNQISHPDDNKGSPTHFDDRPLNSALIIAPRRLKAIDIELIEKISVGQFSNVWKARCRPTSDDSQGETKHTNQDSNIPLDEYAVKVFASHQKSAWSNEKDIYNILSTTNEFILRYYGSDVNEKKMGTDSGPYFNEYWIITEYHPCGSLYDYLKQHCVTWPQIVRFSHSILEGLAYLHSEQPIGLSTNGTTATAAVSNASSSLAVKAFAIAHRDLKSKNILVKHDCQTCCIGDFGLALKLSDTIKLSSVEIRSKVGTRRYMSPELLEGAISFKKETFLRIDVYASALVLWEVISRGDFYEKSALVEYKLPFEDEVGQNPNDKDMKEIVVDKCKRPVIKPEWKKYHDIDEIARTIEECWDHESDARLSSECAASRIRKILHKLQLSPSSS